MAYAAVEIDNAYACGRTSSSHHLLSVDGQPDQAWWSDVVFPLTGDGHPCGSSEHGYHEATIINSSAPEFIGIRYTWEG